MTLAYEGGGVGDLIGVGGAEGAEGTKVDTNSLPETCAGTGI